MESTLVLMIKARSALEKLYVPQPQRIAEAVRNLLVRY